MLANQVLGQERQGLQALEALQRMGIEALLGEQPAVVGHMMLRVHEQVAQALELVGRQALGRPPLRHFHVSAYRNGAVLLQALLQREHQT